jgi:hypothetical protein
MVTFGAAGTTRIEEPSVADDDHKNQPCTSCNRRSCAGMCTAGGK